MLKCYPIPESIPTNDNFTVQVRIPGGEWQVVPCYQIEVDLHCPRPSSLAIFDFAGPVELAVTYNARGVQSAQIRPLSYHIEPQISGNTLTFCLTEPGNLSIEVNGDIFDNLHIFAGPIETEIPDAQAPEVIFFGPGIHEFAEPIEVPSNSTVYLAGGAIVKGMLSCNRVKNVRIRGRGVLYQPQRGVEVNFCHNVEIEGITVLNPQHYTISGGQSQNLTIKNLKSISSGKWSDGIDMMSCSNVLIDGVFMRNSDDCIAIYGHRWGYFGDSRNITVRNSTLWADVAHPVNIGTHGNSAQPEVLEDLTFSNLDILNHDEPQIGYQGCFALNASDENLIRKVHVENVRVEDFEQGQLVNLRVTFNRKYASAPGRGIEDVTFKNLTYTGNNANISIISGYNEARPIKNVVFENLAINGRLIWDEMPDKPSYFATSDIAGLHVGEHVEGLKFCLRD